MIELQALYDAQKIASGLTRLPVDLDKRNQQNRLRTGVGICSKILLCHQRRWDADAPYQVVPDILALEDAYFDAQKINRHVELLWLVRKANAVLFSRKHRGEISSDAA